MTTFIKPVTPPPSTPGGRTTVRVALVIAASVLVLGSVIALGVTAWGVSGIRVVADEKSLPKDMRSLIIDTGAVPASVRLTTDPEAGEPRATMRIVNVPRGSDQNLVVTPEAAGTRLSINGEGSRFMDWGRAGEITVTLPSDMARRLSVTAQLNDSALLSQADLDSLVVTNGDGDVALSGSARRVEIHTRDGDIIARRPISVSESFLTSAVDGDVKVAFAGAPPRQLEATTRDGDIAISLPEPGPYLVRSSGDSTWVRVPETNDPARAAAEVTVRTVDGTVELDTRGRG